MLSQAGSMKEINVGLVMMVSGEQCANIGSKLEMNKKTILSSHFPDFIKKWNKFYSKFRQVNSWYIVSDYCLDDKNKPNDVMTFTIYPFTHPYLLRNGIKQYLSKDIKDFKNLSDKAVNYIKEAPYFFSLAFIIESKNNIFSLNGSKQVLDKTIEKMESWPRPKKEEFIHKINKLRNYLNRKEIDLKTLSNISITTHIMSFIIEFLLIKAKAKHIIWISDRDKITDFQDGIVSELVRLGYTSLLNKRVSDNEVYGFWGGKEYNKEIFDELVRIPDYISGAVASMDFEDVYKVSEKHYNLFDKSIVDNERIYIMHLKHNQYDDTLSNLTFTRT